MKKKNHIFLYGFRFQLNPLNELNWDLSTKVYLFFSSFSSNMILISWSFILLLSRNKLYLDVRMDFALEECNAVWPIMESTKIWKVNNHLLSQVLRTQQRRICFILSLGSLTNDSFVSTTKFLVVSLIFKISPHHPPYFIILMIISTFIH